MLTLGISYCMHDSAAALARDGEILFAVAEERLSRVKHDAGFPARAIEACLDGAGIGIDDVDFVCFGWSPPERMYLHDLRCFSTGRFPATAPFALNSTRFYARMKRDQGGARLLTRHFGPTRARIRFSDHHMAHAASAYACSGFDEAAVVVVDGRGAWESTSIWHGRDGRLEPVHIVPFPNSLGLFYAEMTHFLGFRKYSDEWKVMGLAPYGRPGVDLSMFVDTDDSPYRVDARRLLGRDPADTSGIEEVLGRPRVAESDIGDEHKDLAYAVQDACERAMFSVVRQAVELTGCRTVCLAGGVGLNAKANGAILHDGLVDDLFVQPAAADDGCAIGAALFPHLETDGRLPVSRMRHAYLGPEYDDELERTLRSFKIAHQQVSDPAKVAAELLADGRIVGWFQGRMEFGPRALGNRSILADPRDVTMRDKVNGAVKFREGWRPFAPSFLAERATECLEDDFESPFMVLTSWVRPEWKERLAAVTHVDGSTRPQTVERGVNERYWALIEHFAQQTGVPAVMNTSFNLRIEPVVCTPAEAIRTFFSSGMDALVLGEFVVEK